MRLNADLISKTQQYLNPLNQFYIDLRGYKIPYLENLAATNDQFECIDLTENDITRLEELPKLTRVEALLLANNKISAIDKNFAEMCPKLDSLIMTNNRLSRFEDIDMLATCPSLTRLSLLGNLVCNLTNYRLYTIFKIPTLRVLDFQQVTQSERDSAKKLFVSINDIGNQEEAAVLVARNSKQVVEVSEVAAAQQEVPIAEAV